jgi:hypothetical protein
MAARSHDQESIMKKPGLILIALLAGCGGGSSAPGPSMGPPAAPASAQGVDPFTSNVHMLAATVHEDTEASAIDAVAATAPEDTEPTSL